MTWRVKVQALESDVLMNLVNMLVGFMALLQKTAVPTPIRAVVGFRVMPWYILPNVKQRTY